MSDFNPALNRSFESAPIIPNDATPAPTPPEPKSVEGAMQSKTGKVHKFKIMTSGQGIKSLARVQANNLATKLTFGRTSKMFSAKAVHAQAGTREIVTKQLFGDSVIGHSRNIARREVLKKKEDIQASHDLLNQCAMMKAADQRGFSAVKVDPSKKFENTLTDGICAGIRLDIAKRHIIDKEQVMSVVESNAKGAPSEAAANQAIYMMLESGLTDKDHSIVLLSSLKEISKAEGGDPRLLADFKSVDNCLLQIDYASKGRAVEGEGLHTRIRDTMSEEIQKLNNGESSSYLAKTEGGGHAITDFDAFKKAVQEKMLLEFDKAPATSKTGVRAQMNQLAKEEKELNWTIGVMQYRYAMVTPTLEKPPATETGKFGNAIKALKSTAAAIFGRGKKQGTNFSKISDPQIREVIKQLHDNKANDVCYGAVAAARGLRLTSTESVLGHSCMHKNNESYLQNFSKLEPGFYSVDFFTGDGAHAISYVKEDDGKGYILDPNGHQLRCDSPEHAVEQLTVLLDWYPQPDKKGPFHKDEAYHGITIQKMIPAAG
ncbi:MAG: hypothetical protein Q8K75_08350 [Chlamydiales bacterium]|nr:hypothetical protein [Chlamydiales bacterium]